MAAFLGSGKRSCEPVQLQASDYEAIIDNLYSQNKILREMVELLQKTKNTMDKGTQTPEEFDDELDDIKQEEFDHIKQQELDDIQQEAETTGKQDEFDDIQQVAETTGKQEEFDDIQQVAETTGKQEEFDDIQQVAGKRRRLRWLDNEA